MNLATVILKPGRERPLLNGSPWIFSGAVQTVGNFEYNGQLCEIVSSVGKFLALGYVNPESKITCRILSWEPITINEGFFEKRLQRAVKFREVILGHSTNACRLANSEGDFLPGLVIDRYSDGIVIQILTYGTERLRNMLLEVIENVLAPEFIVERSDTAARHEEKLGDRCGVLKGTVRNALEIVENGLRFKVDLLGGQKTGFYLDQRDARSIIRSLVRGGRVLNLFSYTGGFSVASASAGALEIRSVDSSEPALKMGKENMALNGFGSVKQDWVKADVFDYLNYDEGGWDMVILDPPAFASKKTSLDNAARGYKDINLRSLKKLNPGGILATYCCSHHISSTLFRQIVYAAVADSGRKAQLIAQTSHPADHPFNICHKEGEYLKGLYVRVVE